MTPEEVIQAVKGHWADTILQSLSNEQARQMIKVIAPQQWEQVIGGPDFGLCVATEAEICMHSRDAYPPQTPEEEKKREQEWASLEIEDMAERIAMVLKGEMVFSPA